MLSLSGTTLIKIVGRIQASLSVVVVECRVACSYFFYPHRLQQVGIAV